MAPEEPREEGKEGSAGAVPIKGPARPGRAAAKLREEEPEGEKAERVNPNFEENYGMWGMGEDAEEEANGEIGTSGY